MPPNPRMQIQDLIDFFTEHGPRWIVSQREAQRVRGRSLSHAESHTLTPFFGSEVTASVRLVTVPVIPNPDFYQVLAQQGISMPLDFTQMSGITFEDTVLISEAHPVGTSDWLPLLFHELVHVVQYSLLGIDEFVRRYVNGWAENGFRYDLIPLECDAYELDSRFRSNPTATFSVRAEVMRQLDLH